MENLDDVKKTEKEALKKLNFQGKCIEKADKKFSCVRTIFNIRSQIILNERFY